MHDLARIEVRSYRTVFDLERRVYRIDGIRLNPGGVPVRGVVYAVVLAFAVAALTVIPVVGLPLRSTPIRRQVRLALPSFSASVNNRSR